MEKLQTMSGAIGHIGAEMIVDINTEVVRMISTCQEFSDAAVVIEDPRKEAAEIFSAIKGKHKCFSFKIFTICLFRQCSHSHRLVCWSHSGDCRSCPQQPHLGA